MPRTSLFRSYQLIIIIWWIILGFSGCTKVPSSHLPFIREIFITMPDGVQLAGDLYLPADFDSTQQYPIILEYLPYRKDEHRRTRYGVFSYFVKRSYIVARVDIRGTGRSTGKLVPYEYSERELEDGLAVIEHLSRLPFSNSHVAVLGISWGGFNALQLAMYHPPALKAIVSLMSTDDLYQDDVHFIDGIMHVDAYEIGRDLDNALPSSPGFVLDSAYFHDRFLSDPWFLKYKKQQADGPFWNRASLNAHYEKFDIPTFLIAGLYDGYRDLVERFFEQTNGPKRAIIGPWNHTWPHTADPEPAVEWRREVVDWLDHWMLQPQVEEATYPELIYYQRDYHPPGTNINPVPGKWKIIPKWSELQRSDSLRLFFVKGNSLATHNTSQVSIDTVESRPSDGVEGGGEVMWWGDWPPDQSPFDEHCLVYDLSVEDTISIVGYPQVHLCALSKSDHVNWIVRLNDVAPNGQITLVTGAAFNSAHLSSAASPRPSPVDQSYCMEIELHWTTWTFRPGHRIRVAISNAQWPMFWPTPILTTNYVQTGGRHGSSITLPLTAKGLPDYKDWEEIQPDPQLPNFSILQGETPSGFAEVSQSEYDSLTGIRRVIAINNGEQAYPWGVYRNYESIVHSCSDLNPENTSVEAEYGIDINLESRVISLQSVLLFTSDADSFYYHYSRRIFDNDSLLRNHSWSENFVRHFQ